MTPPDRSHSTPRLQVVALTSVHGGPFSFSIAAGECIALTGRSGSGKSVLLRLIADLDPHDGDVLLDGVSRLSWPAPDWRRQVVWHPAEPAWWAATAALHFADADRTRVEALLAPLGLDAALLDADITRLSTGERQRMALLRSLACEPKVLLLDEPTASLDPASTLAVEALIRSRVQAGLSAVWVTHSTEQAARVGHRMMEVRERRLHELQDGRA